MLILNTSFFRQRLFKDKLDFNISAEDETAVSDALQVSRDKLLPSLILISLTPEDKKELQKTGDKTIVVTKII